MQYPVIKSLKRFYKEDYEAVLVKFYAMMKTLPLIDNTEIEGSSPPGVFVGRWNYPKVYIGPMIPPFHGDTTLLDTPEHWVGKSIKDIVNFRFSMVRGMYLSNVKTLEGNKIVEQTRELALAGKSPDVEAEFKKKPHGLILDENSQPFGPSAPLQNFDVGNFRFDDKVEKAYYDTDLKANDAVMTLYQNDVFVSKIQKAFSVGAFGMKKRRKFVPTRWSITAVDSIISQNLIERTKTYPTINEFRIYETVQLDNRWIVLMIPREWCYELIEAWYPKTIWNPEGREIRMFSDHEFFDGRKTYPDIGGCYMAGRIGVNELLNQEKRQAGVVILRETHPGYIMPVGVFNVRNAVREAVKSKPIKFSTLNDALTYISTKLEISINKWVESSAIIKDILQQRKIVDFIKI